jgi:hypothetical protein
MSGKVNVAKKSIKDPELIDMFNQMCGNGDPDPEVVIPKYDKLLDDCKKVSHMLTDFSKSPFAKVFGKYQRNGFKEIADYAASTTKMLDELTIKENKNTVMTGERLKELNSNQEELIKYMANLNSKYDITELRNAYASLKECKAAQEIIIVTRNIKDVLMVEKDRRKTEKHDLEDRDALSVLFISKSAGDSLKLFSFSSLDFKQISYDEENLNAKLQGYMLYFLHLLYKKGLEIVKLITSPDIDVDKFSEVLVRNISEIRKQIPRCDKAFDKIAASVDMLKGNFDGYYKDFVISQNPGIIIENFVGDVAKEAQSDQEMVTQFRQIMKFYKQKMNGKISDPKINKILGMVGDNLSVLEQETGPRKKKKETSDAAPPDDSPSYDMSDPDVRKEVEESFLPDYVKKQSAKTKKPRK